jgi:phospholipase C
VNRIAPIDILISDNSGEFEGSGFSAWMSLTEETQAEANTMTELTKRIDHAVIIVKEDHTSENYLGTFPGTNGSEMKTSPNLRQSKGVQVIAFLPLALIFRRYAFVGSSI